MTDISLIICTRNRAKSVTKALDSVTRAAAAAPQVKMELVLVDNGSLDETPAILQRFKSESKFPVICLREERPGVSIARNAGIRSARGRILAFTDDDCTVAPDYFSVLFSLYENDQGPAMRGGRVELGDPQDLEYTVKLDPEPATYTGRYPGGFIHGCNMTLSRSAQEIIGYFDERFGAGAPLRAAEDSEYVHRAWQRGIAAQYSPLLRVQHFHGRRDIQDIVHLYRNYTEGDGALFAKHILDWRMASCLVGNMVRTVRECFGGRPMDPTFGFTYRLALCGNLRGIWRYFQLPRPSTEPGKS